MSRNNESPSDATAAGSGSSSDEASQAELGLVIHGRYELIRRIAVGGMGEIYLAKQAGIAGAERLVTIKTLLPHLAAREESLNDFLDEARLASRLNHPGIVSILEVGKWRGINFIAMEYVHGISLSTAWVNAARRRVGIPLAAAAEICRGIALALDHAHRSKDTAGNQVSVVHRDVSPQNIMVRYDGFSKLLDFGIAKSTSRTDRTQSGFIKGKIAYMAPEQLLGRPLGAASDQFALGVILWELGTGKRLFEGTDPVAIVKTIIRGAIPAPATVRVGFPQELSDIIMRMLATSPEERYPHCGDAAKALMNYIQRATKGEDPTEIVKGFLFKLMGGEATAPVDLTVEPVSIRGLEPESVRCSLCQKESPISAPFCSGCGHALRSDAKPTKEEELHDATMRQAVWSAASTSRTGTVKLKRTNIPLIGRDGELAGVRALISNASQGRASSVLFLGPPGIGKTRILDAIAGIAALEGHLVARTAGHPTGENIWCRVIEALSLGLNSEEGVGPAPDGRDTISALAALPGIESEIEELCIPYLERDPPMDVDLLARLLNTYLGQTTDKSVSVIIDDIDWLRKNERQALIELMGKMKNSRFAVIAAGCPGAEGSLPGMRKIPLSPLSMRDIHRFAELIVRGDLPKSVRDLLEHSKGIPGNVALVISSLLRSGALVRVEKDWLVFPAALNQMALPLIAEHVQTSVATLEGYVARVLRLIGNSARPIPRELLSSVEDKEATNLLLELGLVKTNEDGRTFEIGGAAVLRELWPTSDFDVDFG